MTKSNVYFDEKNDIFIEGNLLYNEQVKFIILCTGRGSFDELNCCRGVVVWTDGVHPLGYYSDSWGKYDLVPFHGSITLKS